MWFDRIIKAYSIAVVLWLIGTILAVAIYFLTR